MNGIHFTDTTIHEQAKPRLSRQCQIILNRFLASDTPVTNHELSEMALCYTARISNLRQSGYIIEVLNHDHETGLVEYILKQPKRTLKRFVKKEESMPQPVPPTDSERLEFAMKHLCIVNESALSDKTVRVYDTRGAIDEAIAEWLDDYAS